MKAPIKKDYTRPFSLDEKLVCFDSKKYAKDMFKYVQYLHNEIKVAFEYLHDSGVNLSDNGDQCYQILETLVKKIEKYEKTN